MNKRIFINIPPTLAADEVTPEATNVGGDDEAEIRAMFGITEDTTSATTTDTTSSDVGTAPATTTTNTGDQGESQASNDVNTETGTPTQKTTTTETSPSQNQDTGFDPESKFNKSNSAFAQMRIENKAMTDLIMNLAKASGQDPKNLADAQTILKEGLTKVVSKNRNIPEDVLREMEENKNALAEMRREQARSKAMAGFQQVKDLHGLSRDDINKFADKLLEKQINPFEHPDIDLVKEYRSMYFTDLIAAAKEQGVQEERARALKASQNSTTPSTQQGLPDNTGNQGNPIKTVADLEKFFEGLK